MTFFLLILALQGQVGAARLQTIERTLARAERAELGEPGSERFVSLDSATLARARSDLEAYLRTTPDDASARVLLGRVGRFLLHQSSRAECSPEHGCVLDSTFDDGPFRTALDSALALRPADAAAHFWKARLLADGRPVLRERGFAIDVDTVQMLAHAQRAVALDPRNVRYREFLAVRLADMGHYDEAADAIRPVEGGKHILSLIFQDFAAVPIPEGAVPWPEGHAGLAAVGMDENPPRFAQQAGRSWIVTVPVEQLEAFYRRRWPAFRFFLTTDSAEGRKAWFQYLRTDRRGKLQPAQDTMFMAELGKARSYDGLILGVGEVGPGFDRPGERYPSAVSGKDRFLEVIIVTGRREPRRRS